MVLVHKSIGMITADCSGSRSIRKICYWPPGRLDRKGPKYQPISHGCAKCMTLSCKTHHQKNAAGSSRALHVFAHLFGQTTPSFLP